VSQLGHWWWNLNGGLDARSEMVKPGTTGYEPGKPITVTIHIRNRLGVARTSPTEFVRPNPDGKPALRKGITLSLWGSPSQSPSRGTNRDYPNDVIEPTRRAYFEPNKASRTLAPLEAFEAMRLDLNDWFALTKPGSYRVRVNFEADSGLGAGSATEAYFRLGVKE
jgi:hypothetical protein